MDVITHETSKQLSRALGEAVVRIWSHLPHHVQHHLFKEAIGFQGGKDEIAAGHLSAWNFIRTHPLQ